MPGVALSLRTKVLLASITLLAIPYVGYRYVKEMEGFLRAGLESSVLDAARALAGALHDRPDLIEPERIEAGQPGRNIYAYALEQGPQIDGYIDDWRPYLHLLRDHPASSLDGAAWPSPPHSILFGKYASHLYVLVRVEDDRVVYAPPTVWGERYGDHLIVAILDGAGRAHQYLLATGAPGWVTPFELSAPSLADDGFESGRPQLRHADPRIRAGWQRTKPGYDVEIRIPVSLLGRRLAVIVADVDHQGPPPVGFAKSLSTARLVLPSSAIEGLVKGVSHTPGRRFWVVDRRARVLARGGTLEDEQISTPINALYALLLPPPPAELFRDEPVVGQLEGPHVQAALRGEGSVRWRRVSGADSLIVSAASPVWHDKAVAGAVVVEQTSHGIQTVRRQALAELFNQTLIVCALAGLSLLWLATRISSRLRRLRNETDRAIDEHGRVVGAISGSSSGDEIGDLARSFAAMTERLAQYNHYLEQLGRRLSHELRTPIAIVRSSLDSLTLCGPHDDESLYVRRALDGVARLDAIITRMSEATRLEQALESAEREHFPLEEVVQATVAAYRSTWPERAFEWRPPARTCTMDGVPDLIVQLLDKLISNALEFGDPHYPISIVLSRIERSAHLEVVDIGAALPAEMEGKLFESMVSIRQRSDDRPHLGIGLYVVRLIAEFHGGSVRAENLRAGRGVRLLVTLPLSRN